MENYIDGSYKQIPLAERMRPKTIDVFVGQSSLVGEGCLIRRALMANRLGSCIFYGPPGVGKTTLAFIIANKLFERGVYVNPVISPAAPEGECLLRITLMASHNESQIDEAADIIADVIKNEKEEQ